MTNAPPVAAGFCPANSIILRAPLSSGLRRDDGRDDGPKTETKSGILDVYILARDVSKAPEGL